MTKRLIILACFIIFTTSTHASQNNFQIGLSLSLTGNYAQMGAMQKKGYTLWQKTINDKGGLLGKKVELLIQDDESLPDKARSIYITHIEKTKVDLVIGPYSSGISEAILPVVEQHKYPTLLSGASADRLWTKGYQYAFGVYTPASKYTVGFLQMLVKYKLKKIAIISANDAFSTTLSENTKKWAERFGLQVIHTIYIKKGTKNLGPAASEINELNPDVVIVCGHLDESIAVKKALNHVNWFPRAYYASVGPAMQSFYNILGHDSELTFSSSQWEIDACSKYPFGKEFVELFTNTYQQEPSYQAATAFAAGMILELAVQKANSLDRERLRNMFSQMDTMTLIGRYGVDKNGKQRRHFPLIIQWQQGKKKVVWPEQIKTTDPIFNGLK
ncbi:MAG: amino acid ABC transporter substrate-binding protein [Pseudomonadota bacterium]